MNKNRLEAFSDGVLAIIITIMVLELKPPHGSSWAALQPLMPVFISYVMSFLFVGVYWGNHHHLLHLVKNFSSGIMLANLNLLFWLSLVPFVTGWVGENHFAALPVMVYGLLLNVCGISYTVMQKVIQNCNKDDHRIQLLMKRQTRKGIFSVLLYSTAASIAWVNAYISVAIYFFVAIIWLVPDKNIEKAMQ